MKTKFNIIFALYLGTAITSGFAGDKPKSAEQLSPAYDVYIGFVDHDPCTPILGCGHFKKFSFETAFKNVGFCRNDKGYKVGIGKKKRTVYWYFISDLSEHLIKPYQPVMSIQGEGIIGDHELCPVWNAGPGKVEKVTMTHFDKKFRAYLTLEETRENLETDNTGVPIVPLVPPKPHVRFEATFNSVPSPITWVCETSPGEYDLSAFHYDLELPAGLMSGQEIRLTVPFHHAETIKLGQLNIRFLPSAGGYRIPH